MPLNPLTGIDAEPIGVRQRSLAPVQTSQFTRGVRQGVASVKSAAQGLLGVGAALVGADEFSKEQTDEAAARTREVAEQNPLRIQRFEDVHSVDDAFDFLAGAVGQQVPLLGSLAVGAGVGGLALRAATGLSSAASAGIGAGAASSGLETGLIFSDIANDPEAQGTLREKATVSGAAGLLAGSLDALPVFQIASRLGLGKSLKSSVRRSLGRRVLTGGAVSGVTEGATEGIQTVIERGARNFVNENFEILGAEGVSEIQNAMLIGSILGAGLGGASGALSPAGGAPAAPADDLSALDELDANEEGAVALANKRIQELRGFVDDSELDRIQADAQAFPDQSVFDELDSLTSQDIKDIRDSKRINGMQRLVEEDPRTAVELFLGMVEDPNRRINARETEQLRTAIANLDRTNPVQAQAAFTRLRQAEQANQTSTQAAAQDLELNEFLQTQGDVDTESDEFKELQTTNFEDIVTRLSTEGEIETGDSGQQVFVSQRRLKAAGFGNALGAEGQVRNLKRKFPNETFDLVSAREVMQAQINRRFGSQNTSERTKFEQEVVAHELARREGSAGPPASFRPDDPLSVFDDSFVIMRRKVPGGIDSSDRLALTEEELAPGLSTFEKQVRGNALFEVRGDKKQTAEVNARFKDIKNRNGVLRDVKRDGTRRNNSEFFVNTDLTAEERTLPLEDQEDLIQQELPRFGVTKAISAPQLTRTMVNKIRRDRDAGSTGAQGIGLREAAEAFFAGRVSLRDAGLITSPGQKTDLVILKPAAGKKGLTITLASAHKILEIKKIPGVVAGKPASNQTVEKFIDLFSVADQVANAELFQELRAFNKKFKGGVPNEAAIDTFFENQDSGLVEAEQGEDNSPDLISSLEINEAERIATTNRQLLAINIEELREFSADKAAAEAEVLADTLLIEGLARRVLRDVQDSTQQGSLRRLVKDWSALLSVNARVLDVDEAVDTLLGRNDYGRLRGILDGTLNGFSLPDGRLFVNPQLSSNLQVEVLAHEMGHAVFKQTVPQDFDSLHSAWETWREQFDRPGALVSDVNRSKQRLRTAIDGAYNHTELTLDALSDVDRQYVLDFEEWVADQTSLWLTQPNSKPTTVADGWFSNLVSGIRKIFTNITEGEVITDAQAEKFLNAKVAGFASRMTKTLPHMCARVADAVTASGRPGVADEILADLKKERDRKSRPISQDPLLTAIARLGGINRADAEASGIDPVEFNKQFFGIKRVFLKKGLTLDEMAGALVEEGFSQFDTPQGSDLNLLLDSLDNALRGDPEFSDARDFDDDAVAQEALDRFGDGDIADSLNKLSSRFVATRGTASSIKEERTQAVAGFIKAVTRDPTSDTAHAAILEFLLVIPTPQEKRVLGNAFTQGTVRRQMNQILADSPEALQQMDGSILHTIAYGYQLWASGKLDLGPQTQGVFGKLLDFFSEAVGNVSNQEQSEELLTQLKEQTFDIDRLMSQGSAFELKSVVRDTALQNVAQNTSNLYDRWAKLWMDRLWAPGLGRLLDTNNPALQQLALKIHTPPNAQGRSQGYLANKESKRVQFFDDISRATQGETNPVKLNQLWEAMMTNKVPSDPKLAQSMKEVRKRLDEIHDYAVRKGLPMKQRKNYFPWVYNREYMQNHKDEFAELLKRPVYRKRLDSMVDLYKKAFAEASALSDPESPTKFSKHLSKAQVIEERFGKIDIDGIVEIIYDNIVDADGYGDAEINFNRAGHVPFVRALNARALNFLMVDGTSQDQKDFLKFFHGDFDYTIRTYIDQVVKRAEFTDSFNAKKDKRRIVTDIDTLIREASILGASEEELRSAHDFVNAAQGTHGARTSQWLGKIPLIGESIGTTDKEDLRVINPRLQMAQSWVIVWQNLRVLSMATLTSLADPVGISVRGGSMDTVMASIKALRKDSKAREVAEKLGIISTYTINEMLGSLYSNNFMSAAAQATNEKFFKWTGLSALTRATRVMATGAGLEFLRTHALGKSKNSERFLADLNLEAGDVELDAQSNVKLRTRPEMDALWKDYEDGGDKTILAEIEREERVRKAINRFVDEAILRPNAATRPIWASDPHFALIFHLKSFIYTFHNQILKRVYNEAVLGNYTPFALLFIYVPFMIFADLLRDIARFGAEGNPRKNNWGIWDYTENAVQRAGLPGLGQFALDAKQDTQFGGIGIESFLGPTAQSITALDDLLLGADQGRYQALIDQVPFQNTLPLEGLR